MLEDVLPLLTSPNSPAEKDLWAPLYCPPAPVVDLLNQSKVAKLMREQGFHPKYPIILIPGESFEKNIMFAVPNVA